MGELAVPATAYYGVQTARAIQNFPISSLRFPRAMIRAMGVNQTCCRDGQSVAGPPRQEISGCDQPGSGRSDQGYARR